MMNYIEIIFLPPISIIGLLLWMVIDLVRMVKGKPTADEEWHDIYMDSNMNHGQGVNSDDCNGKKN